MLIRSIIAKGVSLMDTFRTMTELENATTKNKDWDIITRDVKSAVLIAAIHGGGIEPGTTEVCDLIAEKGHYSFYTFKGLRRQKKCRITCHLSPLRSIHYASYGIESVSSSSNSWLYR